MTVLRVVLVSMFAIHFSGIVLAQTSTPPVVSTDKQKAIDERQRATSDWNARKQELINEVAARKQKRANCKVQANERKLNFRERSRFMKTCLAS